MRLLQWSRQRRRGLKPVTGRMKRREGWEISNRENRGFMINWLERRGYMSIQLAGDYMVWSWEWRMHSVRHLDVFSEFVWCAQYSCWTSVYFRRKLTLKCLMCGMFSFYPCRSAYLFLFLFHVSEGYVYGLCGGSFPLWLLIAFDLDWTFKPLPGCLILKS